MSEIEKIFIENQGEMLQRSDISKKVVISYLTGSIIENSEPCPSSETTLIYPPCLVTISRAKYKPIPTPC